MPETGPSLEISGWSDEAVVLTALTDGQNGHSTEQAAAARRELERRNLSPDRVRAIVSNYLMNAEPVAPQSRPGCIPRWVPKAIAAVAAYPLVLIVSAAMKHPERFRRGALIWRWFIYAMGAVLILLAARHALRWMPP